MKLRRRLTRSVIAPGKRVIQYSEIVVSKSIGRGVLDSRLRPAMTAINRPSFEDSFFVYGGEELMEQPILFYVHKIQVFTSDAVVGAPPQ